MRPALEAMFTIEPPPSSMWGSTACAIRKVPVRFTAMMRAQSSNGMACECANLPIPAQLTSTDGRPRSLAAAPTASATDAGSETSTA